jgi:hypothetical protein
MTVTLSTPQTNVATGLSPFNVTVVAGSNRRARIKVSLLCSTAPTSVTATLGGNATSVIGSVIDTSAGSKVHSTLIDVKESQMPASGTRAIAFTITGGAGIVGRHVEYIDATDADQTDVDANHAISASIDSNVSLGFGPINVLADGAAVAFASQNNQLSYSISGAGWTLRTNETDGDSFDSQSGSATKTIAGAGTESVTFTCASATNQAGWITTFDPVGAGGGGGVSPMFRGSRG